VRTPEGGRVEAPRKMECPEGVSPSPVGVGSGDGTVPPPHEIFLTFCVQIVYFGAVLTEPHM